MPSQHPQLHVPAGAASTQRPCGLPRRLLAISYDGVIVLALLLLAGLVALPFSGSGVRAGRSPLYSLYLLSVWFGYFGGCWRHTGATLGMRAWGIRLCAENGDRPGWRACAIRFAVACLSALPLGAGFLSAVFDGRRRGWHDRASGTWLVRERGGSD